MSQTARIAPSTLGFGRHLCADSGQPDAQGRPRHEQKADVGPKAKVEAKTEATLDCAFKAEVNAKAEVGVKAEVQAKSLEMARPFKTSRQASGPTTCQILFRIHLCNQLPAYTVICYSYCLQYL